MLVVVIRKPMVGVIMELAGIWNLIGDLLPTFLSYLQNVPIVGLILSLPGISSLTERAKGPRLPL